MRALATAAAAMTAVLPLTVAPPHAWAAGDCQTAFERWALLSSTVVRTTAEGAGGCLPSDTARRRLLDGLARTRRLCGDSTSNTGAQQTRTLLNINHSFIASLGICRSESADTQPGWVTRAAPAPPPAAPRVAAPKPSPPPPPKPQPMPQPRPQPEKKATPRPAPPTGGPRPVVIVRPSAPPTGGPRPAVIARPSAPPPMPKAAAAPPPKPPCLEVSSAEAGRYAFVNRRCRGHAVMAVIETRNAYGKVACKGYEISESLAVRAAGNTPPRLNYECVASRRRCNKDRLGDMFPECEW